MFITQKPAQHPVTLAFQDRKLEEVFLADHYENILPQLRLDLLVGIFLYALFGIHDYWVIPEIKQYAWMLRYLFVCPLLMGFFLLSYSRIVLKVIQLSTFVVGFSAGAGLVLMIMKASPPGKYLYYAGLLLIVLFYFRQRFITASALIWSIFILYLAVSFRDDRIPDPILFSNTFILFIFSLTGMYMSYTLEQHIRSRFLLRRTIEERNNEIAQTNLLLKNEIQERRQAETALQNQMEFLRTLLDTIPNPIMFTDTHGRHLGCNQSCEIFFGQTNDRVSGRSALDLLLADGINAADTHQTAGVRTDETVLRHADGTYRTVLFSRASYTDRERQPAGMVGVVVDITELKKAGEEKLRLEAHLFQTQKIEALGQLAGGMAHEFNNILTAIIGYTQLLQKNIAEGDPLRLFVDNTLNSGQRAAKLIRDIQAFGRKQLINPKAVDLNDIVRESYPLLSMMTGEDIELNLTLTPHPIRVFADSSMISQVLMNLISNARDAMPKGGQISIRTTPVTIEHSHETIQPGAYGMLTIRDTGIGFDQGIRERIFEPFFTTKDVGMGTGLGLSIVHGIIKQHNGSIDAESEFTKGTEFKIHLPIASGDACAPLPHQQHKPMKMIEAPISLDDLRPSSQEERVPSGSEKVLLAEDNDTVLMLMKNLLQENGYTVFEATNGEEALRKFMEHADDIQLLLLDVIMPKKNGWEVYDTIRKIRPGIRVIFMSGYTADVFASRQIPEGSMNLLEKPVPPGDLLRAVRKELDRDVSEHDAVGSIASA